MTHSARPSPISSKISASSPGCCGGSELAMLVFPGVEDAFGQVERRSQLDQQAAVEVAQFQRFESVVGCGWWRFSLGGEGPGLTLTFAGQIIEAGINSYRLAHARSQRPVARLPAADVALRTAK
jgi:hypothetical protein